ncbi:SDR family oxidoreductase [Nakamurella deserti]|uniref:SDR family oxidoreductase n=1 Tax=Nakamurella deserti TaxID=2164074 RepID=UPI000DBE304C|nr:SDR family oxidoreductase [Nakamurella deserti]
MTVVVTGATGQLGGRVVRLLDTAGVRQRLVVRDPARAPDVAHVELSTIGSYTDADGLARALADAGPVLMVSAAESADRLDQHRSFVDAAAAAGVPHLVYTSYYGASPDATFAHGRLHAATEDHIRASGVPFTFLRDNLYLDFLPDLAGTDGVIRGPGGSGAVSAVARDDVAEVAAVVLQHPADHAGRTYDLTGPEELTLAGIADKLTALTGRDVRYEEETLDEAFASRASYGAPDWLVDAWVSTYTAIAAGEMAGVSDAVPTLIGHPATSLADLIARQRHEG